MNSSILPLVDIALGAAAKHHASLYLLTCAFRQRYWSRSYLGYPPVRNAQPNPTHYALAALQWTNIVPRLITQNVDGLHHKAIPQEAAKDAGGRILELHGTLHVSFPPVLATHSPRFICYRSSIVERDTISTGRPSRNSFRC